MRFGPVRAEIEPCAAQIVIVAGIAEIFDGDASPVSEEQDIGLVRDIAIKPLEAGPGDGDQSLGLLAVLLQPSLGEDDGFGVHRRIKAVVIEAAAPGLDDIGVAHAGIALPDGFDLTHMVGDGHAFDFSTFPKASYDKNRIHLHGNSTKCSTCAVRRDRPPPDHRR